MHPGDRAYLRMLVESLHEARRIGTGPTELHIEISDEQVNAIAARLGLIVLRDEKEAP